MNDKHIFFDLDNTLWDSQKNSRCALDQMFKEKLVTEKFEIDFEDFISFYEVVNESLWDQLRDGQITKNKLRQERFRRSFDHFGVGSNALSSWFETNFPYRAINYSYLVKGATEMLDDLLKQAYSLHIVTNGFKEVSRRKISETLLNGKFKTIVCADEIGISKPNPKIFQYALDEAKTIVQNSIFIGDDWEADAIGAADFGMKSIYYNRKKSNDKDSRVLEISHLYEIPKLMEEL